MIGCIRWRFNFIRGRFHYLDSIKYSQMIWHKLSFHLKLITGTCTQHEKYKFLIYGLHRWLPKRGWEVIIVCLSWYACAFCGTTSGQFVVMSWGSSVVGHDYVIKWKHFPRYWPFVRGIHRSPVNSPHKGQWRGALVFSLICARIKGWVNNSGDGYLIRHRAHYDVIAMWGWVGRARLWYLSPPPPPPPTHTHTHTNTNTNTNTHTHTLWKYMPPIFDHRFTFTSICFNITHFYTNLTTFSIRYLLIFLPHPRFTWLSRQWYFYSKFPLKSQFPFGPFWAPFSSCFI